MAVFYLYRCTAINQNAATFLANYEDAVYENAMHLRSLLLRKLPGITEQVDIPAKMIAYCYGQKYAELICTIIPSKKGLKLGFNRGTVLHDPDNLLEGSGKISRYVVIRDKEMIGSEPLEELLAKALEAYKKGIDTK